MQNKIHVLRAVGLALVGAIMAGNAAAQDQVRVAIPQRGTWETSVADLGEKAGIFA
jgi:NitT/TauT family transport system substrate-binding protein